MTAVHSFWLMAVETSSSADNDIGRCTIYCTGNKNQKKSREPKEQSGMIEHPVETKSTYATQKMFPTSLSVLCIKLNQRDSSAAKNKQQARFQQMADK